MKYLLLLSSSLLLSSPVLAQEEDELDPILTCVQREEDITVVATGLRRSVTDSGQSISVIGAAEIAAVQGPDIARVLERLPGVTLARNGGLGSTTSLFVRGASSQQLLVLVDGVRLADVAAPGGGFDLGTVLSNGISKIELLRGSNSVPWGSDAMGGVLAITTARPEGTSGTLEYGANDTLNAYLAVGTGNRDYTLSADLGYTRSDGISAYAPGTEADAFRQWNGSVRGTLNLTRDLTLHGVGRYADSRINFDGFPAPSYSFADTPEYQDTRQGSGLIGLDYRNSLMWLGAEFSVSDTQRDYFDPGFGNAPNFTTSGRSWRAALKGRADLAQQLSLDFGASHEWSKFSTSFDPEQTAGIASLHALLGYHNGLIHLTGGLRLDDHGRFGSRLTFGANGSVDLGNDWRLRASYGEGFKAPTLYQLYGYGGNVALQPETSHAWDAGIELGDRNRAFHAALTLFRRDSRDLIDYVVPSGYFNIARARAQGFELEGRARLNSSLRVAGSYSYVQSTNPATGKDLARRPRHAGNLSLDWIAPWLDLDLGADLRIVSASYDDAGNSTRIAGHTIGTLRASLPLSHRVALFGRIENLWDEQYQTAAGYGSYGRSATLGVKAKF